MQITVKAFKQVIHPEESENHKGKSDDAEKMKLPGWLSIFSDPTINLGITMNRDEAYSILQAIMLSICQKLNIDNGEVAGCLQYVVSTTGIPDFSQ